MRQPLCPYFGKCGGCATQHLEYDLQLANKKAVLERMVPGVPVQVFSDNEFFYRNRLDMVFHPEGLGFREKGKWYRTVDVARCVISEEPINALMAEIRTFFKGVDAFDAKKFIGTYRYAVIRTAGGETSVTFVLNMASTHLSEAMDKVGEYALKGSATHVSVAYVPPNTDRTIGDQFFVIKGRDTLCHSYLGKRFEFAVQGFFQNNHAMAEKLQRYCRGLLEKYDTKAGYLLDFYCGVGTFGIVNADLFKWVTMIESVPECIEAAKRNMAANGITNATPMVLEDRYLKRVNLASPLFVINDPPRSGMHPKALLRLRELEPRVILYVSCNVNQLSADLPKLADYKVKSAALFDLFPQTNHMEGVVELVRRS